MAVLPAIDISCSSRVISRCEVAISRIEELSGLGAAYMVGISSGMWGEEIFDTMSWNRVAPGMEESDRERKYKGYQNAVGLIRTDT